MISNEWENYKLEEFCEQKKDGYVPNSSDDLNYIGLEHIEQQTLRIHGVGNSKSVTSNKFKFSEGDILFGKLRPYFRKVYRPTFSGVCSTDIMVLKAKNNFDQGFLFYFLANPEFVDLSNSGSTGTRMPRADWNQLKSSKWLIPPQPIQRQIGVTLSSLDDKIELNRQTNQTLEAIAQALFKEWFVDFNFPGATGEMVDSKLGEMPKGWRVGKVKDVCQVNRHAISKGDKYDWIDYIEISEVNRGIIGDIAQYRSGQQPSRAKRKITHGDIVLSTVRPNRGSYFLAFNPKSSWIVSTGFAVFTPSSAPFSFMYLFLTDEKQLEHYGHVADGGAYPAINPSLIMDINLFIPDKETLNAFHQCIEPMLGLINFNLKQNNTLVQLRDTLLPKLMKGEIEIRT